MAPVVSDGKLGRRRSRGIKDEGVKAKAQRNPAQSVWRVVYRRAIIHESCQGRQMPPVTLTQGCWPIMGARGGQAVNGGRPRIFSQPCDVTLVVGSIPPGRLGARRRWSMGSRNMSPDGRGLSGAVLSTRMGHQWPSSGGHEMPRSPWLFAALWRVAGPRHLPNQVLAHSWAPGLLCDGL